MAGGIDASGPQRAQMLRQCIDHRAADTASLPCPIDRHVVELRDERTA